MIDHVHTRGDEIVLEDDFEWVNAWATATGPKTPRAAPAAVVAPEEPVALKQSEPAQRDGTTLAADGPPPAAVPPNTRAAPMRNDTSVDTAISPTVDIDHPDGNVRPESGFAASLENVSLPDAPDAASDNLDAASAGHDEAIAAPVLGSGSEAAPIPLFEAARRIGRWTNLFRIVTRAGVPEVDPARELFVVDAPPSASSLDETASGADESCAGTITDADRLTRDIAEIEVVRDRLLAMPVGATMGPRLAPVRTSDYVPILVGAVLAFTSLVVFGAAASFVSLR